MRALKAKLRERDAALEARGAELVAAHTELAQLQRALSGGGGGGGGFAAAGVGGSPGRRYCLTPPRRLRTSGSRERTGMKG